MAGDSYRPGRDDRREFTSGGGDTYRPGRPANNQARRRDEFTFRAPDNAPQYPAQHQGKSNGPPSRGSGQRKRSARNTRNNNPAKPQDSHVAGRNGTAGRENQRANGNRFQRRKWGKPAPHERPILQSQVPEGTEQVLGVTGGTSKFLPLGETSDEESAIAKPASPVSDEEQNSKKKTRIGSNIADGDDVPRWSNPDPYTVLPPSNLASRPTRDIVSMIRDSKNTQAAEEAAQANAVAANDDFISFGDEQQDDQDVPAIAGSLNEIPTPDTGLPLPSDVLSYDLEALQPPSRPQTSGRKRKFNEGQGEILDEWLPRSRGGDSAPWCKGKDYSTLVNPIQRLHNEILDFYDYVKPTEEDRAIRDDLIQRVDRAISRTGGLPGPGTTYCFGSSPEGLNLPMADLDLVYISKQYSSGGSPLYNNYQSGKADKKLLYKVQSRLERDGLCAHGRCQVIPFARVPILKFIDRKTGIHVDISFEKFDGVDAQRLFQEWKHDFLDLPYLVALIKQFLLMRGLNEVANQGLGGFSIICLVVSYIKYIGPVDDIGTLFLGFLNFYGNVFDMATQQISLNPFEFPQKGAFNVDGRPHSRDRLSIIDPNNPTNDVSGGTAKARLIFDCFAKARRDLLDRMKAFENKNTRKNASLLEAIIGGNYEPYDQHRLHMGSLRRDVRY